MKVIEELVGYFERRGRLTSRQIEQLLAKGFLATDAPYSLVEYRDRVGETFCFRLTGSEQGHVWGTEVYTTDSALAAVAVHSGVLQAGETGAIRVTILPAESAYHGSTRNGITSLDYGPYLGAFRVDQV